jgi:putative GTP pyrophosphokinase
MTKSQIDKLGERLKVGELSESDLQLLDSYRRSFADSYEKVIATIRDVLGLEPTGRHAKSTQSIGQKLRRESIRLSQIQDIAGCRIIVANLSEQKAVVESLRKAFDQTTVIDRREKPSHGYRAVHVVVKFVDRPVEVQVRTKLQHIWAELSEKLSDVESADLKYGGGPERLKIALRSSSNAIGTIEALTSEIDDLPESQEKSILRNELIETNQVFAEKLADIIKQIERK